MSQQPIAGLRTACWSNMTQDGNMTPDGSNMTQDGGNMTKDGCNMTQ